MFLPQNLGAVYDGVFAIAIEPPKQTKKKPSSAPAPTAILTA